MRNSVSKVNVTFETPSPRLNINIYNVANKRMDVIEDIAAALGVEPVELLNAKLESPNVKTSTAPDSSEIMNFTRTLIEQQQNMIESLQKTVDSQQERIQQLKELVQTYEKSLYKSKSRAVGSADSGICTN